MKLLGGWLRPVMDCEPWDGGVLRPFCGFFFLQCFLYVHRDEVRVREERMIEASRGFLLGIFLCL